MKLSSEKAIGMRARIGRVFIVIAMIATQLVMTPGTAQAATTGSAIEPATWVATTDFHSEDTDEVQRISHNSAGPGTFTLSFQGQTTAPIDFAATALDIETALDGLTFCHPAPSNSECGQWLDVSVGGASPQWDVTFDGGHPTLTGDDTLLGGTLTISVITPGVSSPIDPTGVTYIDHLTRLIVSDSEIDEEPAIFDGVNLWNLTMPPALGIDGTWLEPAPSEEASGLAYNKFNQHVYISNDQSAPRITDVDPVDGIYGNGNDTVSFLRTKPDNCAGNPPFCIDDPEDVAYDTKDKQIFIAGGIDATVTSVKPGANGKFDGLPVDGGDDIAGVNLDLSSLFETPPPNGSNIEGITYRAVSDTLLLTERRTGDVQYIYEITKTGRLVRLIDISAVKADHGGDKFNPADIAIAPNGHMFVVDRGRDNNPGPAVRDGLMYELTAPFANLAPYVDAGVNKVGSVYKPLAIAGDTYDDGQPNPVAPTVTWSKQSGPGTVTFANKNALATTATFSANGVYVLKLTSSDGSLSSSDTMQVTVQTNTFIDDDGHIFENAIEWLYAQGITQGCNPPTNNKFCPNDFVTRGQMAVFLVRALGYVDNGGGDLFIDDDGRFFENSADKLKTAGVTVGCNPPTNNKYCGDDFVTRGQMAAFLVRAMGYVDNGGGDLFIDDDGHIFENAIDKLGAAGVTQGCNPPTNDKFCPDDFVTRGQMAAFLKRALT